MKYPCTKCHTPYPEHEFIGPRTGRIYTWCKACRDAHNKKHRARPEIKRAVKRSYRKFVELSRRLVFTHLTTNPCVDCGEADPVVLEFDHCRGMKLKNLSKMRSYGANLGRLQ